MSFFPFKCLLIVFLVLLTLAFAPLPARAITVEGETIKPRLLAAAGVYLALPGGIVLFALPRVDPSNPVWSALGWGFLYGVTVYAVYDLTNRATLRHWPVRMAAVDICWGGVLCATVTLAAEFIGRSLR